MTEPLSDERLAEIRAGLDGVTPGPWRVCETHEGEIIGRPSWPCRRHGVDGEWRVAIADELDGATFEQDANAAHIARLDPQTVAAILSRLDKAEAGLDALAKHLLKGEFSSMHITFNDHKSNYVTLAQEMQDRPDWYEDDDFISPEDRQKCAETDTIWSVQWYPHTPVGFCHMHASSFALLLSALTSES